MSATRICVTGRVQGVFFRAETESTARTLGVNGWVRNLPDGSVEIHAEGTQDQLDRLLTWCKRGPERASVEHVEVKEATEEGCGSFEIKR